MPPLARKPLVIAYHLVWTAYGTWLPNDPRGSGSRAVLTPAIAELGPVHYGRRKLQPARRAVRDFYEQAEPRLLFPVLRFNDSHRMQIGAGLADAISSHRYTCYACAVLPDHVHVVIRKHKFKAEQMIEHLQSASRLRLSASGAIPADHPVWTRGGWKSFLDSPDAVRGAIRDVENNPPKGGFARQTWPFVQHYDGWPHQR